MADAGRDRVTVGISSHYPLVQLFPVDQLVGVRAPPFPRMRNPLYRRMIQEKSTAWRCRKQQSTIALKICEDIPRRVIMATTKKGYSTDSENRT